MGGPEMVETCGKTSKRCGREVGESARSKNPKKAVQGGRKTARSGVDAENQTEGMVRGPKRGGTRRIFEECNKGKGRNGCVMGRKGGNGG